MRFFERLTREVVTKAVNSGALDGAILGAIRRNFEGKPDRPLSLEGFRMACGEALRDYWPDVPHHQAADWLLEYVGVPYGHPDHGWTYNDAKLLAREYVADFGEGAQ